jgi:hypothetical protein
MSGPDPDRGRGAVVLGGEGDQGEQAAEAGGFDGGERAAPLGVGHGRRAVMGHLL